VAGLCEPDLLGQPREVGSVFVILDRVMRSVAGATDRREEPFRVLRKALGYGWSVAVAALPEEGLDRLERWIVSDDTDVRWIMRENLKKRRLTAVAGDRIVGWRKLVGSR
jgi:hypothetical protein